MKLLAKFTLTPDSIGYETAIKTGDDALVNILELVYTWAGIVAVLVIIISSILFITARGDANQMKRSKDALRGAVIGLIVVMVAFALTRFIIGGVQG